MNNIQMIPSGDYMLIRNLKTNEFMAWRTQITIAYGVTAYGDFDRLSIKPHTFFEAYTAMKNKEAEEFVKCEKK